MEATRLAAGRGAPSGRTRRETGDHRAGTEALLATTGERELINSQGELRRITPPIKERFDVAGPIQSEEGPRQRGQRQGHLQNEPHALAAFCPYGA